MDILDDIGVSKKKKVNYSFNTFLANCKDFLLEYPNLVTKFND